MGNVVIWRLSLHCAKSMLFFSSKIVHKLPERCTMVKKPVHLDTVMHFRFTRQKTLVHLVMQGRLLQTQLIYIQKSPNFAIMVKKTGIFTIRMGLTAGLMKSRQQSFLSSFRILTIGTNGETRSLYNTKTDCVLSNALNRNHTITIIIIFSLYVIDNVICLQNTFQKMVFKH